MTQSEINGAAEPALGTPQVLGTGQAMTAGLFAWLVPGAGHFYLGRRIRGPIFFLVVMSCVALGYALDGSLYWVIPDQPLSVFATLGSMGAGLPYFVLRFLIDFEGQVTAPGFEYGKAFFLTAGLMNLLLILDVWDISRGKKE